MSRLIRLLEWFQVTIQNTQIFVTKSQTIIFFLHNLSIGTYIESKSTFPWVEISTISMKRSQEFYKTILQPTAK